MFMSIRQLRNSRLRDTYSINLLILAAAIVDEPQGGCFSDWLVIDHEVVIGRFKSSKVSDMKLTRI